MAAGEGNNAALRKAASLLMCRDGNDGLEVLVLRRAESMRFLPGFLSFPGGSLDAADRLDDGFWAYPLSDAEQLDDSEYAAGAIRETLEETGLLTAVCDGSGEHGDGLLASSWQTGLLEQELTLGQLLDRNKLRLDGRNLRFVGRWITPPFMPKRFDTRFFVTTWAGQAESVRIHSGENDWAAWVRPGEMLRRIDAKAEKAAPPTRAMLTAMAGFATSVECFSQLYVPGPDPNDPMLQSVLDDLNR